MSHTNPTNGKGFADLTPDTSPLDAALAQNQYSAPHWATFRQWNKLDRSVKKGEKGTRLEGKNGFRWHVFNIDQTKPRED